MRARIRAARLQDESGLLQQLLEVAALGESARATIVSHALELVHAVRGHGEPSLMEAFLAEYGLSTAEGVALMCLAEALLRVPDADTIDDLIADKITAGNWDAHSGRASSALVNTSTWALMLTGRVLEDSQEAGLGATLRGVVRRLGEPLVRAAVGQAMAELGRQFVLGETIDSAELAAAEWRKQGHTFSYDMLGEAARTDADARRYHLAYADAITHLARGASGAVRDNPGISVKLSALHPRYEASARSWMLETLVTRTRALAVLAADGNLGFNIDAEEADRLDLSLDVIDALLASPALAGWDGIGVVVQAYGRRALPLLDWLYETAHRHNRRIMVRLVKGAYWDTEIKRAQVLGEPGYPVLTRKRVTDVSYIACARRLLAMTDRIYPQFATHNAHSAAAVVHLAREAGIDAQAWEFQRLHGMGETLHAVLRDTLDVRSRIYAPVGVHEDLLAYLVRRLLENGANSSFVHQVVDVSVPAEIIAADPLVAAQGLDRVHNPRIPEPLALFPGRRGARGHNLMEADVLAALEAQRAPWAHHVWHATPLVEGRVAANDPVAIRNPARPDEIVGWVAQASAQDVQTALAAATAGASAWAATMPETRAAILERASDLYESHAGELHALLAREAGKTWPDAIAEVREAVDFLREYARQVRASDLPAPRGVLVCISPWNFPLAIFTGQLAAGLATGNVVLAKPAEQTPLIAHRATGLLLAAGVPQAALQLLPGDGPTVGGALVADARVDGVCFTGGTDTARHINRTMARHLDPAAVLIAETGGINAMLVDSTALPEQAVRDIVTSAFGSAGQRCSALRVLYLQDDIADRVLTMLRGAMDVLVCGDPWDVATDVGPVIDAEAAAGLRRYLAGRPIAHRTPAQDAAQIVPPALIEVDGIEQVEREVFGPVLHVARFRAHQVDAVIDAINARGFGLTFAVHTRLDDRVQLIVDRLRVGNVYVNRNQVGAVVGSQPFGGEGESGTGPKAGGPHYLPALCAGPAPVPLRVPEPGASMPAGTLSRQALQAALDALDASAWAGRDDRLSLLRRRWPDSPALAAAGLPVSVEMPGPTGERNVLRLCPRAAVLCLGTDPQALREQVLNALAAGCAVLVCHSDARLRDDLRALQPLAAPLAWLVGEPDPQALTTLNGIAVVARRGDAAGQRRVREALAARAGPIVPLQVEPVAPLAVRVERHLCIDTTAAGGNATLMAELEQDRF